MSVTNRLVFDPTDANTIAASASVGAYLRSSDGTLLTHVTNGAREELDVNDKTAGDLLATIDADTSAMAVDLAAIEVELLDQGTVLDNIYVDTQALVVDLAAIEVELLDQGTVLDNIYVDTQAMVVDLAAIEAELLDQGTTLDSIETEVLDQGTTLDSIETSVQLIDNLVLEEDAVHSSGANGVMPLAVRNDTLASLVSADGDYAPLQVNEDGALYCTVEGLNIDVNDVANVAIQNTATAVSAIAVNMVGSALANRSWCFLANEGNHSVYFGKTGVTAINGFPLHPGEKLEVRVGAAVTPQLIGEATASAEDIRVMELS